MNPLLLSKSNEWYTPAYIVNMARDVLGEITLDPASSKEANEIVRAKHFFSEGALERSWEIEKPLNIFLNPPGGRNSAFLFWEKLLSTDFDHAIFIGFNIEILRTSQKSKLLSVGEFPICIPSKRIEFLNPDNPAFSPTHANVIAYVPRRVNRTDEFHKAFFMEGVILNG